MLLDEEKFKSTTYRWLIVVSCICTHRASHNETVYAVFVRRFSGEEESALKLRKTHWHNHARLHLQFCIIGCICMFKIDTAKRNYYILAPTILAKHITCDLAALLNVHNHGLGSSFLSESYWTSHRDKTCKKWQHTSEWFFFPGHLMQRVLSGNQTFIQL